MSEAARSTARHYGPAKGVVQVGDLPVARKLPAAKLSAWSVRLAQRICEAAPANRAHRLIAAAIERSREEERSF